MSTYELALLMCNFNKALVLQLELENLLISNVGIVDVQLNLVLQFQEKFLSTRMSISDVRWHCSTTIQLVQ